jgi:hypothetical protein
VLVFFVAVGDGFGAAVRGLLRDGACVRVAFGLALALALGAALGLRLGDADGVVGSADGVTGVRSTAAGRADPEAEVSWTAPTVPPTASATPIAAVAAMPAGEEIMRVRECLPATGPVLSLAEQTGSDRNERSTSEVNVIMVVCP